MPGNSCYLAIFFAKKFRMTALLDFIFPPKLSNLQPVNNQ